MVHHPWPAPPSQASDLTRLKTTGEHWRTQSETVVQGRSSSQTGLASAAAKHVTRINENTLWTKKVTLLCLQDWVTTISNDWYAQFNLILSCNFCVVLVTNYPDNLLLSIFFAGWVTAVIWSKLTPKCHFFIRFKVVWQQFSGEVGMTTTVWLQISSGAWIWKKTTKIGQFWMELFEKGDIIWTFSYVSR